MNGGPVNGEPVTLEAGGLQVVFTRLADRFRHSVIEIGQRGGQLLASWEGADNENWPPSPPLQEMHVERRGERKQVALLVGRAGRSHWSLSVEVDPAEETIAFDAACRCSAPMEWLGSSYELPCFESAASHAGTIVLSPGYELQVAEGQASLIESEQRGLRIAASWHRAPGRQTVRWRYRIGRIGVSG